MSRRDDLLRQYADHSLFMANRIERNIAENRKGIAHIRVLDAENQPVPDAVLKLRQRTHDFNFGCSIFLLDEMESTAKNEAYKAYFQKLFNLAVAPFYWDALEPVQGQPRFAKDSPKVYRRPAPDLVLDFCEPKGIRVKGHCLVYHGFTPDWVPKAIPEAKRLLARRMQEIAARYADRIGDWDVENESLCSYPFDRMPFYNEPDYLDWSFIQADRYFSPANRLFINEASDFCWAKGKQFKGPQSAYYQQIQGLLERGRRVDCIGMQYHQFVRKERELADSLPYDPETLYEVLDCYSRFNRPIQISEITIPSYESGPEEEALQAELVRNLYRIWFSHRSVDAINWWNLADGYTFVNPRNPSWNENYYAGGLVRHDLTAKPAYQVLDDLINREWRTQETLAVDADGRASFEGFYSEYDVEIIRDGRTSPAALHLAKGLPRQFELQVQA